MIMKEIPIRVVNILIIVICTLLLLLVVVVKVSGVYYESKMEAKGNEIVNKINYYVTINNTAPNYLSEIGINEDVDFFPFYYQKVGVKNYILSFDLAVGESKTYYSDSERWEYGFREIK